MGNLLNLLHGGPLLQSLVHNEMSLAGRSSQHPKQKLLGFFLQLRDLPQTVSPGLQRTYGLLEGFLIILPYAHDFAHGPHLGAQPILHALKLLKGPAGKLYHHIVSVRHILIQRAVFAAGNVL